MEDKQSGRQRRQTREKKKPIKINRAEYEVVEALELTVVDYHGNEGGVAKTDRQTETHTPHTHTQTDRRYHLQCRRLDLGSFSPREKQRRSVES